MTCVAATPPPRRRRERSLLTTGQAANALGIDPATLWRWEKRGLVTPETHTIGGQARWQLDKLRGQVDTAERERRDQNED